MRDFVMEIISSILYDTQLFGSLLTMTIYKSNKSSYKEDSL